MAKSNCTISVEHLTAALNYVKHIGAGHIMRGEPHPQQHIVDWLTDALTTATEQPLLPTVLAWQELPPATIADDVKKFYGEQQVIFAIDYSKNQELTRALAESVRLQSHYAALLNQYDGGNRKGFADAQEWINRLRTLPHSKEEAQ